MAVSPSASQPTAEERSTLLAVAANQFLSQVAFGVAIPFLPFYVRELGMTDPTRALVLAGAVGSAPYFTMAVMAPIWGALADRFGRKLMLLRVAVGGTLIVGGMGFAANVLQLFLLRLAQGGFTGSLSAGAALVAAATPRERAGRNLGLVQAAVQTGNMAGPSLGGLLIMALGLRQVFLVAAVILVASGVAVALFAHEPARPAAALTVGASEPGGSGRPARFHLRPRIWQLLTTVVGVQFAASALFAPLPLFAEELRRPGDSPAQVIAGFALGLAAIFAAVSAPVAGRLIDRVGPTRVMGASLLLSAVAIAAEGGATAVWQMLALQAVVGVGTGGQLASLSVLTKDQAPAGSEGRVFGLAATAQALGFALGPITGSAVAAAWGLRMVFPLCSVVLVAVALVVRARGGAGTEHTPGPARLAV